MIYQHRRKDKTNSFTHKETFNTFIICIQKVLTRLCKHVSRDEICTLFYEQAVYEKSTKTVKDLLDVVRQLIIW